MPVVTSKRYRNQDVGMGISVVHFDEEGIATHIVQVGNEKTYKLVDAGVVAQARGLPSHFDIIEDHEIVASGVSVGDPQGYPAEDDEYEVPPPVVVFDDELQADLEAAFSAEKIAEASPDGCESVPSLESLTKRELLDVADSSGIEIPSRANKAEVLAAILAFIEAEDGHEDGPHIEG